MSGNNSTKYGFREINLALRSISVFRNILKDKVVNSFAALIDSLCSSNPCLYTIVDRYGSFYFDLVNHSPIVSFKDYIIDKILYDENPYTRTAENKGRDSMDSRMLQAASQDLFYLQLISDVSASRVKEGLLKSSLCGFPFERKMVEELPSWDSGPADTGESSNGSENAKELKAVLKASRDWRECIEAVSNYYRQYGCGLFSQYRAFSWEGSGKEGRIVPITAYDPIRLSDLVGYETQRKEVISNTLQFLKGFRANNMLLYGDRGTGKSSTVKAVLNEYHDLGLRIIEIPKNRLVDFQVLSRQLRGRKQKFIIFVDDLSFEDSEENYTALKSVLEGGLESKPANVVIYATSNRRHLIKENFSDRAGLLSGNGDDEIRSADTMQEKLSLSDRFGITVVFPSPDKSTYLEIAEGIASRRGLTIDRELLHQQALKWELWYNGRSPRTARQFIDWLEGQ
ncbi:MAG: ATP-binding protein [Clostridiales bacterium]|jgi:predicted AAA+ superfamily ATPase|nr:ATP-binding protein [Eubacteriales bacterium]MDH7564878.1 ATP-binding protein [Clostridiales bacterium]